jgi:hypothetical protein
MTHVIRTFVKPIQMKRYTVKLTKAEVEEL